MSAHDRDASGDRRCREHRATANARPTRTESHSFPETSKRLLKQTAGGNKPLAVRINIAKQAGYNADTRQRLAALNDPRNAEKLRFCPHLYRTLLERRGSGGHRPIPANIVAFKRDESRRSDSGQSKAVDNGRKKPCLLTVQEWEQLRMAYNRNINAKEDKSERSIIYEKSDKALPSESSAKDACPLIGPERSRRPPTRRERQKQREYRLKRWTESTDNYSSSEDEAVFSPHSNSSQTCAPQRRRHSKLCIPHRKSEVHSRAMSNMTKILAAVRATSPAEQPSVRNTKSNDKRSNLKTTDSGIWCEEALDTEASVRLGQLSVPGKGFIKQEGTTNLTRKQAHHSERNCEEVTKRHRQLTQEPYIPKSKTYQQRANLQTVYQTSKIDQENSSTARSLASSLPTGCEISDESEHGDEKNVVEQRLPSVECNCVSSTLTSYHKSLNKTVINQCGQREQYRNRGEVLEDCDSICLCCDEKTCSSLYSEPSQPSKQPRPSILKRPRPEVAYVLSDSTNPLINNQSSGTWTYMCGCCEPPQQQTLLLGDRDSLKGAYAPLPVIYECVCADCTRQGTNSAPRYYQLTPQVPVEQRRFAEPAPAVPSRYTAHQRRRSRVNKKGKRQSDSRSIGSNYSTTSRFAAMFLECFHCFDDDSDSLSSAGSDSDNDDGNDGGDESDGYEEHGEGVSVDDDSDGGDSGSESGGDVSLNSAELFDDQNNMFDIKNAMGEGEESDGAPNTGGSDSDSLTELRSRSKKGSGTSDDEENSDDFDMDDGEFDDSLDSIAIYERE